MPNGSDSSAEQEYRSSFFAAGVSQTLATANNKDLMLIVESKISVLWPKLSSILKLNRLNSLCPLGVSAQARADKKGEHAKRSAEWFGKNQSKSTSPVLTDEIHEEFIVFSSERQHHGK